MIVEIEMAGGKRELQNRIIANIKAMLRAEGLSGSESYSAVGSLSRFEFEAMLEDVPFDTTGTNGRTRPSHHV